MGLSIYNLKKWFNMLTGKSILHVEQGVGKGFSRDRVNGYFNDLTEKVTKMPELLGSAQLPTIETEQGNDIFFSVSIFQYGLGAYDLYLQTEEEKYRTKFLQCADWAMENQEASGAWKNFTHLFPDEPYGAMCQGEAASLLIRAYQNTGEERYRNAARLALDFMLLPLQDGGTTDYSQDGVALYEATCFPLVLNGWIFAWFGLYDYVIATADNGAYKSAMEKSLATLVKRLPEFDLPYWSKYDVSGRIASPFYHGLHIAQLQAMYLATGQDIFRQYGEKWENYKKSFFKSKRAFVKKAIQKVLEK